MTTITAQTIRDNRTAAIAAYAAAREAFLDAYLNLRAHDFALANRNLEGVVYEDFNPQPDSFRFDQTRLIEQLDHPRTRFVELRWGDDPGSFAERLQARIAELQASIGTEAE